MNTLESVLQSMIESGKSDNEIADEIASTLAHLLVENDVKDDSPTVIDRFKAILANSVKEDDIEYIDAAACATIAAYKEHPEWTTKEIDECFEEMEQQIPFIASLIGHTFIENLATFLDNKRKEEEEKKAEEDVVTAETDRAPVAKITIKKGTKDPKQALKDFLKNL